jgi:hypothetical protein
MGGGGGTEVVEGLDLKDRCGGPERFVVDAESSVSWGSPASL